MEKSNQRKVGVILSYLSIIISTIVQLIFTPILIRMIGQSEYGLYSLVASIMGYLTVLDLGFGNAIVIYTTRYRTNNEHINEQKMLGMFKIIFYVISIITMIIGIILYFNLDNIFSETMSLVELDKAKILMLLLLFNLVVTFSFNIYSSIITAYEEFTFQKVLSIINILLKPMLMTPLLFLGYKSIALCVIITLVNIIIVFSNYYYCKTKLGIKIKYQGFDKLLFIEMFGYSFFIFLSVIVDKINWSVDQFILGIVSGTIAVSIYSIASQINQLFIGMSTAISGVLLPKISQIIEKKATNEQLTYEMIKVGRLQYYVIFLMTSGLILFGKTFIMWWAGIEYEQSYYIALLLIIPISLPLIQNLGISIMQAMNKYKFRAIVTIFMACFNIIMSYYLAKMFGAIGPAIGTAISLITCNVIIMNIYYVKVIKLNIWSFWKEILKMTFTFLIPLLLIIIVMNLLILNGIISVLVYGFIYSISFFIVSYFITMNKYEKDIINKIFIKLNLMR